MHQKAQERAICPPHRKPPRSQQPKIPSGTFVPDGIVSSARIFPTRPKSRAPPHVSRRTQSGQMRAVENFPLYRPFADFDRHNTVQSSPAIEIFRIQGGRAPPRTSLFLRASGQNGENPQKICPEALLAPIRAPAPVNFRARRAEQTLFFGAAKD